VNILVAAASKHGSTWGIAQAIARELGRQGASVSLMHVEDVTSLDGYDALVIGSGVYMQRWLSAGRTFVDQVEVELDGLPVWLFSSGPLGERDEISAIDPAFVANLVAQTHARQHMVFAGRLSRQDLGIGERLIAIAVHAPEGDFRDWEAVTAWAGSIGQELVLQADAGDVSGPVRWLSGSSRS
jgi:menaquinone-dependent protoporphyrinogen oxidase